MANNYDQSSDVDSAMEQDVSLTTAATTAQYDQEVLSDGEEHARQQPDVKTQTEQVNEADLRKLIMAIQRDTTIDRQEKARRMQVNKLDSLWKWWLLIELCSTWCRMAPYPHHRIRQLVQVIHGKIDQMWMMLHLPTM